MEATAAHRLAYFQPPLIAPKIRRNAAPHVQAISGYRGCVNCTRYLPNTRDGHCDFVNNNTGCEFGGGGGLQVYVCIRALRLYRRFWLRWSWCHEPECTRTQNKSFAILLVISSTSLSCGGHCSDKRPGEFNQLHRGYFDVERRGRIAVNKMLWITRLTIFNITEVGASQAVVVANGEFRIFRVVNATLHVRSVKITNGSATVGGVVFLAGATWLSVDKHC